MNILFITHQPQHYHGWARYTNELSTTLNQLGHQTTIYNPQLSTDRPWINPYKFIKQLLIINQLSSRFDLVHIVSEPFALFTPFLKKPTFLTAHGSFAINQLLRPFPFNHIYQRCYQKTLQIISVSHFTKHQLTPYLHNISVSIVPNGINIQNFSYSKPSTTHQPLILSVGAVKQRKGYHISIPAAFPFLKKYTHYKYLIVGSLSDHSYHQQLLSLIHQHQLSDQIKFLGEITDKKLISLYQKARLFLLTPIASKSKHYHKFEGFGLVFLEAQSCGCPVITSRSGGAPETIINHQTGLLVPEGNIYQTSQTLTKILTHPKKLKSMNQAARAHAQKFSWQIIAKKYLNLYRQALTQS